MLYDAIDLCLGLSRLSSSSAKVKSDAVDDLCLGTARQYIILAAVCQVCTHMILFSSGAGEDVALY